jgi:hypothetical protein
MQEKGTAARTGPTAVDMHLAWSISILAADIVAVCVVAVVVRAVGAIGRGTNRCGPHRRRTVSATWIIPSPVTRATRDAVSTAYATGIDSALVNASSSDGAAVEASTASVPTTPTARERVVRDKAGRNQNECCKNR